MPHARPDPQLLSITCLGLLSVPLLGQETIRTFEDPFQYGNPGFALGWAVDEIGDVNADGVPDHILGNPGDSTVAHRAGAAFVQSGADGSVLHAVYGVEAEEYLGSSVSGAGDLDADGTPDFLVGSIQFGTTDEGRVQALSGRDGSTLHALVGGPAEGLGFVARAGDVDMDGHDDFLVGTALARARVHSGRDGSVLHDVPDYPQYPCYGCDYAGGADVDADGWPDFAVGNPHADIFGSDSGVVTVYSGRFRQTVLHEFFGTVHSTFGWRVALGGDVDGDGHADVLVSDYSHFIGGINTGRVYVYSGADGSTLHTFDGKAPGGYFGLDLDFAGDVNGDGHDDVIIGAHDSDAFAFRGGEVNVFSGVDGAELFRWGGGLGEQFGWSVSGAGDVDGDGLDDFLVGQPRLFRATLFSSDPPGEPFCSSLATSTGSPATIGAAWSRSVALNELLLLASPVPDQPGLFYYGAQQVSVPFGNGIRCVGGFTSRLDIVPASHGLLWHRLDVTQPPTAMGQITAGSTWSFQAWFRDPAAGGAGFNLSDGLELTFLP